MHKAMLAQDLIPRFRSSPKFQQYVAAKEEIESQRAKEKEKQRETSKKASQSSPVFAVRTMS